MTSSSSAAALPHHHSYDDHHHLHYFLHCHDDNHRHHHYYHFHHHHHTPHHHIHNLNTVHHHRHHHTFNLHYYHHHHLQNYLFPTLFFHRTKNRIFIEFRCTVFPIIVFFRFLFLAFQCPKNTIKVKKPKNVTYSDSGPISLCIHFTNTVP